MLKARYTHDCKSCKFLGQSGSDDVHYCPEQGSLILRFGSEGPDYSSFPMGVARLLAQQDLGWTLPVALAEAYLVGRSSVVSR